MNTYLPLAVIRSLGISATHLGYYYLNTSILLILEDENRLLMVSKLLYPLVAEIHSTTPSCVERNILSSLFAGAAETGNVFSKSQAAVSSPSQPMENLSIFSPAISKNTILRLNGNKMEPFYPCWSFRKTTAAAAVRFLPSYSRFSSIPSNSGTSKNSFKVTPRPPHSFEIVNNPGFFVVPSIMCMSVVNGTADL